MNPFADILPKALKHTESAGTISIKGQLHSIISVLHPQTGFLHLQKNAHSTHLCSTIEPENVFHLIILKIPSHPLANVILHARSVIMLHNVAMWVSFTPQCSPKWLEWTTPNVFIFFAFSALDTTRCSNRFRFALAYVVQVHFIPYGLH